MFAILILQSLSPLLLSRLHILQFKVIQLCRSWLLHDVIATASRLPLTLHSGIYKDQFRGRRCDGKMIEEGVIA